MVTDSPPAGLSDPCPLIVDLDGSLIRTNLLWEGLATLVLRQPGHLAGAVAALLRGRAPFKAYVANRARLDLETVPLEPSVMRLIQEAIEAGRRVILTSGAHESQVVRFGRRIGATEFCGSDGSTNLIGSSKLTWILTRCDRFDYIGNGPADLPM